jgi:hypothetical protein
VLELLYAVKSTTSRRQGHYSRLDCAWTAFFKTVFFFFFVCSKLARTICLEWWLSLVLHCYSDSIFQRTKRYSSFNGRFLTLRSFERSTKTVNSCHDKYGTVTVTFFLLCHFSYPFFINWPFCSCLVNRRRDSTIHDCLVPRTQK